MGSYWHYTSKPQKLDMAARKERDVECESNRSVGFTYVLALNDS